MTKRTPLLCTAALMVMLAFAPAVYAAGEDDASAPATPASAPADGVKMHKEWKGDESDWHLSPEKRKMIHEAMESLHQKNEALWEKKFNLEQDLHALMKAPQFDAQAYLAKKEQLDAIKDTERKNKEETFAGLASKFTPKERMMLMMMEHRSHGGHHHFAS